MILLVLQWCYALVTAISKLYSYSTEPLVGALLQRPAAEPGNRWEWELGCQAAELLGGGTGEWDRQQILKESHRKDSCEAVPHSQLLCNQKERRSCCC